MAVWLTMHVQSFSYLSHLITSDSDDGKYITIRKHSFISDQTETHPDGLTLIPWQDGRCATWDVTVTNTVAAHVWAEARRALAQQQQQRSHVKRRNTLTFPRATLFSLAFETFSPINQACCNFLSSLGHRLFLVSDDPRETSFLFQRQFCSNSALQFSLRLPLFRERLPAQFFDQPRRT